jgi:hypothetical protein
MWDSITAMATSILLPAKAAATLDRDVIAAWMGTDRPTAQALLTAGLPIPLEEVTGDAKAAVERYKAAGLIVEAVGSGALPGEWLKATAILALTAIVFRVMGSDENALMNLSTLPAMAAAYTLTIAGVTWAVRRRRAAGVKAELATARGHLATAEPVGPGRVLVQRIRELRREVVGAGIQVSVEGELLRALFDLEAVVGTTVPADASAMIEALAGKLEAAR